MKYCRFTQEGQIRYGLVEPTAGEDHITRLLLTAPHLGEGELDELPSRRMQPLPLDDAALLPPVEPTKIVCVGRNYIEHAKELGHPIPTEPLIFLKPNSSLLSPGGEVRRPTVLSQRVDHEGELGVIIGRRCRHLSEGDDVRPYILGYTCVNDVTARDLQNRDGQWTRAKSFDTFAPIGEERAYEDSWDVLTVVTRVNGVERQRGTGALMVFAIPRLIAFISRIMTLEPGDLVSTGTPAGVGRLSAGDTVEVEIS